MLRQTAEFRLDELCHYGKNYVKKTSWTDMNPGWRYSACENFRAADGCTYFVWIDPSMCTRAKQIITWLLKRVNKLAAELKRKTGWERLLLLSMVASWIIMYLFK